MFGMLSHIVGWPVEYCPLVMLWRRNLRTVSLGHGWELWCWCYEVVNIADGIAGKTRYAQESEYVTRSKEP